VIYRCDDQTFPAQQFEKSLQTGSVAWPDVLGPNPTSEKSGDRLGGQISDGEISLPHPLTEFSDKLKLPTGALPGVALLTQLCCKLFDVLA
jgi:hypothetical protein